MDNALQFDFVTHVVEHLIENSEALFPIKEEKEKEKELSEEEHNERMSKTSNFASVLTEEEMQNLERKLNRNNDHKLSKERSSKLLNFQDINKSIRVKGLSKTQLSELFNHSSDNETPPNNDHEKKTPEKEESNQEKIGNKKEEKIDEKKDEKIDGKKDDEKKDDEKKDDEKIDDEKIDDNKSDVSEKINSNIEDSNTTETNKEDSLKEDSPNKRISNSLDMKNLKLKPNFNSVALPEHNDKSPKSAIEDDEGSLIPTINRLTIGKF
jgi:hypothetical protein